MDERVREEAAVREGAAAEEGLRGYYLFEDELPEHIRNRLHEILPHATHRGKPVPPHILETYVKIDFLERFLQTMRHEAWRMFDAGDAKLKELAEQFEYPKSSDGFTAVDEENRRMLLRDKSVRDAYGAALIADVEQRAAAWLRYEGHIKEEDRKWLSSHYIGFTEEQLRAFLDEHKEGFTRELWLKTLERGHFSAAARRLSSLPLLHYDLSPVGEFRDRGKLEELLDYASQGHDIAVKDLLDLDSAQASHVARYLQTLKQGVDPITGLDEAGIPDYLRKRREHRSDYLDPAQFRKRDPLDHYLKEI